MKSKVGQKQVAESEKKPVARREYDVSPEKFIRVWQSSSSAEEVSQKLGMPRPIVHARVSSYRQAGIKLKKMKRHSTRGLDVASLNQLIDSLASEQADESDLSGREAVHAVVERVMETLNYKPPSRRKE